MATISALRSRKVTGAIGSVIEGVDLTRPLAASAMSAGFFPAAPSENIHSRLPTPPRSAPVASIAGQHRTQTARRRQIAVALLQSGASIGDPGGHHFALKLGE